jgi:hypothetical protein
MINLIQRSFRTFITSFFSIIFVVTLAACGGGDGGGGGGVGADPPPTIDPDQSFSLSKFKSSTVGTVYSTELGGADSDGFVYGGFLSLANRAQIMLEGILVTPRDVILSITDGGVTVVVTGTSYVDIGGNFISFIIQTTGEICVPVTPDQLPDSVMVGDFGILSTLICNDDTMRERNWRVEDAGSGNINLIGNTVTKDLFNTLISFTDTTYTLDDGGNIVAYRGVTTIGGYTLTLESL